MRAKQLLAIIFLRLSRVISIVAMSLAEQVLREFEENPRLRRRMAEIIVSDSETRLAVINAVLADMATKQDLNQLRNEVREELNQLRSEVRQELNQLRSEVRELRSEVSGYLRWTVGTIIIVWGSTVIPILLRLIGAI